MKYNNPGNIRLSADVWKGQSVPGDSLSFVTFISPDYGYRALFILIRNYILQGNNTIEKIINKYAPPSDNNPTEAYINFVSVNSGINRTAYILPSDFALIYAIGFNIARFETGEIPNDTQIKTGFKMAFNNEIIPDEQKPYLSWLGVAFGLTAIWLFGSGR